MEEAGSEFADEDVVVESRVKNFHRGFLSKAPKMQNFQEKEEIIDIMQGDEGGGDETPSAGG